MLFKVVSCFVLLYFNSRSSCFECGVASLGAGLVHGGRQSTKGQWPFSVALYQAHDGVKEYFFCTGILITSQHVLTVASCVQEKGQTEPVPSDKVSAVLGKYDLSQKDDPNSVNIGVSDIHIHEDWAVVNDDRKDADIAILVLVSAVQLSNFIQPVCLPSASSVSVSDPGYLVGWGESEETADGVSHENILRHVEISAVNDTACIIETPFLAHLISFNTFCAGGSGRGPCIGDLGAGFFVKSGRAWTLKGISSTCLLNIDRKCDVKNYSLFSNVAKYVDWIKTIVKKKSNELD